MFGDYKEITTPYKARVCVRDPHSNYDPAETFDAHSYVGFHFGIDSTHRSKSESDLKLRQKELVDCLQNSGWVIHEQNPNAIEMCKGLSWISCGLFRAEGEVQSNLMTEMLSVLSGFQGSPTPAFEMFHLSKVSVDQSLEGKTLEEVQKWLDQHHYELRQLFAYYENDSTRQRFAKRLVPFKIGEELQNNMPYILSYSKNPYFIKIVTEALEAALKENEPGLI